MIPESENGYMDINSYLQKFISPWYESLKNPESAQQNLLTELLEKYAATDYGAEHNASNIASIEEYQKNFPIKNYVGYLPYFNKIQEGNYKALLSEPPECWVMTRGSTGKSKIIPVTQTHLKQIYNCGARAIINHTIRKENFEVLMGNILNLNFPSSVHTMNSGDKEITYGYSSGTYARLNPMLQSVSLIPRQEDIDALGSGIGKKAWEKRFELVYQQALDKNVTATMGVTPVVLAFARYIERIHGKKPKDLWKFKALFCTSVAKIQFRYGPILQKYFGKAPIVEMYTATEGAFAQQYDDLPYVTPNYDAYFFEVDTGKKTKMLNDLKRGEWGRLIISSCLFPRYDIGDMVESAGKNYFRIFGRRNTMTLLEHRLYRFFLGWLI